MASVGDASPADAAIFKTPVFETHMLKPFLAVIVAVLPSAAALPSAVETTRAAPGAPGGT